MLVIPRRRSSFLVQRGAENKLSALEQAHRLPVSEWKASHVLAWLEVDMNMVAYGQACYDNIKSGKVSHLNCTVSVIVLQWCSNAMGDRCPKPISPDHGKC